MNAEPTKCYPKRTGFRSAETWAIVAVLFGAGMAMGYLFGQLMVRSEATAQVTEVRNAYVAASQSKDDLIRQCLAKAGAAADTAKTAAQSAEQAVEASKK